MLESPGIILESTHVRTHTHTHVQPCRFRVSNQPHAVILKHLGEKNTHLQKPETGLLTLKKSKKNPKNVTTSPKTSIQLHACFRITSRCSVTLSSVTNLTDRSRLAFSCSFLPSHCTWYIMHVWEACHAKDTT